MISLGHETQVLETTYFHYAMLKILQRVTAPQCITLRWILLIGSVGGDKQMELWEITSNVHFSCGCAHMTSADGVTGLSWLNTLPHTWQPQLASDRAGKKKASINSNNSKNHGEIQMIQLEIIHANVFFLLLFRFGFQLFSVCTASNGNVAKPERCTLYNYPVDVPLYLRQENMSTLTNNKN